MDCPRCGMDNDTGRPHCQRCAAPLPEPFGVGERQAAGAERRQLTVMMCDLAGSTALSQRLDPEDLRAVLDRYQQLTRRVVLRFGGYIARHLGDAMLIYFGYPQAHEDDAARAVHAALGIVEALERLGAIDIAPIGHLKVRIGIATGLVVVGDRIGDGASEEAAAVGETPNLAARLQALAEPNGVMVSDRTAALTAGRFDYEDRGLHTLKGFEHQVRAWRVGGASDAASRFEAERGRSRMPLIGREREVEQLITCWKQAAFGRGGIVLVVGEAGIGKSRVVAGTLDRIAGDPSFVVRCQCSPYHAGSALHPVIDWIERAAGFARVDNAANKLDKLDALVARAPAVAPDVSGLTVSLLSLPGDRHPQLTLAPQQLRLRTLHALLEVLELVTAEQPGVVLVEDVHWIDPTSLELLEILAHEVAKMRLLVILTSRPENQPDPARIEGAQTLRLGRLSLDDSLELATWLVRDRGLSGALAAKIVERGDGVPLFIEELAKTLEETGSDALVQIPATLQDSLMARLDRLGSAKEIAQIGAVIGREFTRDLASTLAGIDASDLDDALTRLADAAIVSCRSDMEGSVFVFKHALVQDAAYASLLRSRRRDLHGQLGELLAAGKVGRADAPPEVVAHHYAGATRHLLSASFFARAAMGALERSANVEAVRLVEEGLTQLTTVDPGDDRDRLALQLSILQGAAYRAVRGFASSEAEAGFMRALPLCERLQDTTRLIDVRRGLFSVYYARGALALARDQGRQVAAIGEHSGDRTPLMLGYWMLGCMASWQGRFAQAQTELERAVSLYDSNEQRAKTLAQQIDPGVNALCHLAWVLWIRGFPDRAADTADRAVQTARTLAQPFALAMALFFSCVTRACRGEFPSASGPLDQLLTLTAELGLGFLGSSARVLKGQEMISAGECFAGIALVEQALVEFRVQEAGLGLPWSLSILATGHLHMGDTEQAMHKLDDAFEAIRRNGEHHWEAEIRRLSGEVLLASPGRRHGEADDFLRSAVDVARRQDALSLELRATMSLAKRLDQCSERNVALQTLTSVRGRFTEGEASADLGAADLLIMRLRGDSGERTA